MAVRPGAKVKARGNPAASSARTATRSVVEAPRAPKEMLAASVPALASIAGALEEEPLPLGADTPRRGVDAPEFPEIPRRDPVLPPRPKPGRDGEEPVPAFDGNVEGPQIGAPGRHPGELPATTDYVDVLPRNWVRQSGAVELEDDEN